MPGLGAEIFEDDPSAVNEREGGKVGGGRGVPFHLAGTGFILLRTHDELPVVLVIHLDAEFTHFIERNVDIRSADEFSLHVDLETIGYPWGDLQQGGEELAGDIPLHPDRMAERFRTSDGYREAPAV